MKPSGWYWLLPLATAGGLYLFALVYGTENAPRVLEKGSVAPRTMRSDVDAVFDLHQTAAAEAEEVRQSYIPIYNRDNQSFQDSKWRVIEAALARPIASWSWVPSQVTAEAGGSPRGTAPGADQDNEFPIATSPSEDDARRAELTALLNGCFGLLEPLYSDGVIADNEYPKEKATIRIYGNDRYVPKAVEQTHRFSELRGMLEHGAKQFFFKTNASLRKDVIDFLLQRLPANLTYADENRLFIADISEVTGFKVVLIRRGDVLVNRGSVVNTRSHYALKASTAASSAPIVQRRLLARYLLLGALFVLFMAIARSMHFPRSRATGWRPFAWVYGATAALVVLGETCLAYWPLDLAVLPQAAVAIVCASVFGRGMAILAAATVAPALAFCFHFDLMHLVSGAAGGLIGGLLVRRRRRGATLASGVLVGIAQAVTHQTALAAAGELPGSAQIWTVGQAFFGGILSGLLAFVCLPFVQHWLGQASRGKLEFLADFEHPLLKRMRDRKPSLLAHSMSVMNLADQAAKSVHADRLLTRVGALYHGIGQLAGNTGPQSTAAVSYLASSGADEVEKGVRLGQQFQLPEEVLAFIREHRPVQDAQLEQLPAAHGPGSENERQLELPRRPRTIETALVLITNELQLALSTPRRASDFADDVRAILTKLSASFQFAECDLTQKHLRAIETALAAYLERQHNDNLSGD